MTCYGLALQDGHWLLVQELCVGSFDKALTDPAVKGDLGKRTQLLKDAALGIAFM